jgi:hypothetical protein
MHDWASFYGNRSKHSDRAIASSLQQLTECELAFSPVPIQAAIPEGDFRFLPIWVVN